MNEKMFKFMNPNNNDIISTFQGFDLSYFFLLLKEYRISYRENLNIEKNVTFGFEIECECAKTKKIKTEFQNSFSDGLWTFGIDDTVYSGGEVSTPILTDCKSDWLKIEKVCNILNKYAKEGESCGGHIHIGSQILGDEPINWINFIKLWIIYEKIIFRFGSGEYLTNRIEISKFASPMSKKLYNSYNYICNMRSITLKNIINLINYKKFEAINFSHVNVNHINRFEMMNTIEFRSPNGTLNPIIWQNNLNLFVHLLNYAKSEEFNTDQFSERINNIEGINTDINFYQEIYIYDALELADLIFDNNLDKINFLKQYFKNFQNHIGKKFEDGKVALTRKN